MLSADDLELFVTVGSSASLAAAARTLGITPPAVSQRLTHIERKLALRLVERSNRGLKLTSDGELLFKRANEILRQFTRMEDELAQRGGKNAGVLRVVAPLGFGRTYVVGLVIDYHAAHPDVRVDLNLSDRPGIGLATACDILIQIGELRDSEQVATVVAPNRRLLCAAPAYLDRYGAPSMPADLRDHRCIALRENDEDVTLWRFENARGERINVRIEPVLSSNDSAATKALALAGAGITVRSEWDVAEDIAARRLVPLLPGWKLPDADITAILGRRGERAARVDDFLGLLRRSLRPVPWRQRGGQVAG